MRDGGEQEAPVLEQTSDRKEWELVRSRFLQRMSPSRALRKLRTNNKTAG